MQYTINNITVEGAPTYEDALQIAEHAAKLGATHAHVQEDGEWLDVHYYARSSRPVPFERIRRITGYLTPVTRFNDGKRAELNDRVKHGL